MLRDAGVRTKLLAVLAIPTLLLAVVTTLLVGGQVSAARQAGQVKALTDVAIQVNRVVHSLQEERSATLAFLNDPQDGNRARMQGQRLFTDEQVRSLRTLVAESPVAQMSTAIQAAVGRSANSHEEIPAARESVDAGRFFATETDVFYSKVIRTDLDLPGVVATSGSSELVGRLQAYEAVSTAIELAAHERDIVENALLRGTLTEADYGQAAALVSQQRIALADFQRSAETSTYAELDDALADAENYEIDQVRRDLPGLLKGRPADTGRSVAWVGAANSRIGPMVDTESTVVADIAAVAGQTQRSQEQRAVVLVAAAVLGLGLALALAIQLARRITRPLRRLTVAAGEIGAELPRMVERMQIPGEGPGVTVEPIPVESTDEIGRLAEAFNTVNDVTVQVAQEQAALRSSIAEMFVNVARRNQVLLGRQLSQLDAMEAGEEDPDVLERLFTLDHLATRMRRNAESLLVLAGIDSTRRLRRSMPLSDVIRTAVGEIESYDRIDLSMSEDPEVSGRHALSVAHLLAEVLENATHFSNPETRVVVSAAVTGHGVDLTVTDYGLGMSDAEVAEANERIAHPPVAEIAVSQRLGLFVVGRLAARLGASVLLRRGRSAGLVVAVALPTSVFEGLTVEQPADEQPADGHAEQLAPDADAADDLRPPVLDTSDLVGPQLVHRPADLVPPAAAPAVPAFAALQAGAAMVPEMAPQQPGAAENALPTRRSSAASPSADASLAPVADDAVTRVTDDTPSPAAPLGHPVVATAPGADPSGGEPGHPVRRGLFARWSRTPAEPGAAGDLAQVADAEPVDLGRSEPVDPAPGGGEPENELTVTEVAVTEAPVAEDPVVEVLAVELPADAPTVEIEVEMVPLPAGPPEPAEPVLDLPEDPARDSAAEELPGAAPTSPARRGGLFARWSRTPATPAPEIADVVEDADVVEVAESEAAESEAAESEAVDVEPVVAEVETGAVDPEVADVEALVPEVSGARHVEVADDEGTAGDDADAVVVGEAPGSPPAPARRRLFGRRARGEDRPAGSSLPVSEPDEPGLPVEPPADPEPLSAPVSVAPEPEPVAPAEPEPVAVAEPEPAPAPSPPAMVYAKAVDILPNQPARGGSLFGRHRRPAPVQPVPSAPVPASRAASAAAPAAPVVPAEGAGTAGDLVSDLFGGPAAPAAPYASPAPPVPVAEPAPMPPAGVAESTGTPVPDLFGAPVAAVAPVVPDAPVAPAPSAGLPARVPVAPVDPPVPVEHPSADLDRMAAQAEMHQSALSELRGLYEPSFTPVTQQAPAAPAGLSRRTPKAATEVPDPREATAPPPRTRSASEVRGMLSGFRAGVERGRGSAGGDSPRDDEPGSQPGTQPTSPDTSTR